MVTWRGAQGAVSRLGVFLDPIADKIMVAAVILMLVATGHIAGANVIAALVILLREIAVSGLREFLAPLHVSVPVSRLAKWKTTLQMVSLGRRSYWAARARRRSGSMTSAWSRCGARRC